MSSLMRRSMCALALAFLAAVRRSCPDEGGAILRGRVDPPARRTDRQRRAQPACRSRRSACTSRISRCVTTCTSRTSVPVQRITGPDWINSTRFDISATFPGGATPEQFPKMMQSLLHDRFKLQAHMESRESPIYALEVARGGLKIDRSPGRGANGRAVHRHLVRRPGGRVTAIWARARLSCSTTSSSRPRR